MLASSICHLELDMISRELAVGGVPKAWSAFAPADFSESIAVTAVVLGNHSKPVSTGTLAAFAADGSLRGVQPVSAGAPHLFFLMVFANTSGEHITFKYAADASTIEDLDDTKLVFKDDEVIGDLMHPYELRL